MEQGPVLEAAGLPLGIVSGIAGQTRLAVTLQGVQVCSAVLLAFSQGKHTSTVLWFL